MFFKRRHKVDKVITAKFIYKSFYKPQLNELSWQKTNEKELNEAIKKNGSMFSSLIKLGNLYQPTSIIQGFELKGEEDE